MTPRTFPPVPILNFLRLKQANDYCIYLFIYFLLFIGNNNYHPRVGLWYGIGSFGWILKRDVWNTFGWVVGVLVVSLYSLLVRKALIIFRRYSFWIGTRGKILFSLMLSANTPDEWFRCKKWTWRVDEFFPSDRVETNEEKKKKRFLM